MFSWEKIYASLYRLRLYLLAVVLFCFVLTLLELSNVLPTRQAPISLSPLKVVDSTKLNMSQSIEFVGTVLTSTSTDESHVSVSVMLQAHEIRLLAEGDILFIPRIGYGVVKHISTRDDSVMAAVEAIVQIETDLVSPGDQVHLYR